MVQTVFIGGEGGAERAHSLMNVEIGQAAVLWGGWMLDGLGTDASFARFYSYACRVPRRSQHALCAPGWLGGTSFSHLPGGGLW